MFGKLTLQSLLNLLRRIVRVLGFRLLIGLISATATLLLFRWLADEVAEGETIQFDHAARETIHAFANPALTVLMRTVTLIGENPVLVALGAAVSILFLLMRWRRAFWLFLITMSGASLLLVLLKTFFRRTRPEPFFDTPLPASFSFPSGHALLSFCFFGVLAWLVASRLKSAAARAAIWVFAATMVLLIGISRIYLGVHYPSDVIAGYSAAFVWVFTISAADLWLRRRFRKHRDAAL